MSYSSSVNSRGWVGCVPAPLETSPAVEVSGWVLAALETRRVVGEGWAASEPRFRLRVCMPLVVDGEGPITVVLASCSVAGRMSSSDTHSSNRLSVFR